MSMALRTSIQRHVTASPSGAGSGRGDSASPAVHAGTGTPHRRGVPVGPSTGQPDDGGKPDEPPPPDGNPGGIRNYIRVGPVHTSQCQNVEVRGCFRVEINPNPGGASVCILCTIGPSGPHPGRLRFRSSHRRVHWLRGTSEGNSRRPGNAPRGIHRRLCRGPPPVRHPGIIYFFNPAQFSRSSIVP